MIKTNQEVVYEEKSILKRKLKAKEVFFSFMRNFLYKNEIERFTRRFCRFFYLWKVSYDLLSIKKIGVLGSL